VATFDQAETINLLGVMLVRHPYSVLKSTVKLYINEVAEAITDSRDSNVP